MEPECPWVESYSSSLIVHLHARPEVTALLEEPNGNRRTGDAPMGRVSYSITGYLTPAEALAFASNVTLAANLAEAWEKGEETRETVLEKYGKGGS